MATRTSVQSQAFPRRLKVPRSYYAVLGVTVLLLFLISWIQEAFDVVLGVGYFIGLLLAVITFAVLNRLALKSPLGKLYGHAASVIVVGGMMLVLLGVILAWNRWAFPSMVHSVLRTGGQVTMARVTKYELYKSDNTWIGIDPVESVTAAGFIRVHLQLPDGRTTSLAINRAGPAMSKDDWAVLTTEILQSQMKVRYWSHGAWLARPEIEFSPLTKDEGCVLLHQASPVCQ